MTNNIADITAHGREHYSHGVNQVLAGFQLIEEALKSYIGLHFDLVRMLLGPHLHFEFRREDYKDAALGKLTHVFSKLCLNKELVADLRAVTKRRDHIAHRALLKLYEVEVKPQEYSRLLEELLFDMQKNAELLERIAYETNELKHPK